MTPAPPRPQHLSWRTSRKRHRWCLGCLWTGGILHITSGNPCAGTSGANFATRLLPIATLQAIGTRNVPCGLSRTASKSPPLVKMVSPTSRECHSTTGHRNRSSQGRHRRCLLWSKEPFNGRPIGTPRRVVIRGPARGQWRRACRCLRAFGISRSSERKRFERVCLMSFVPLPRVACCVFGPYQIPCVRHHCFAMRLVLHCEC